MSRHCPDCGTVLAAGYARCPACARRLSFGSAEPTRTTLGVACPRCGTPMDPWLTANRHATHVNCEGNFR